MRDVEHGLQSILSYLWSTKLCGVCLHWLVICTCLYGLLVCFIVCARLIIVSAVAARFKLRFITVSALSC